MTALDPELTPGPRSASIVGAIGLTTLVTAGGYAITLLQQVLYARSLGVNADTDALGAVLAWAIGTTGFVGTTLTTVYLPAYVRANQQQPSDSADLKGVASMVTMGVGGLLMVATFLAASPLAAILLPGAEASHQVALADLLRLGAPLGLTWPLIWLAVATVNAHERYVLAAASAVLPPLPVIAVLVIGATSTDQVVLAYAAGTVLQLFALWAFEARSRPHVGWIARSPAWVNISRGLIPVGAAFALLSIVPLEIRGLASFFGAGAAATSDYASRLVLAGQQVLLSGLLAVVFTRWSKRSVPGQSRVAAAVDSVHRMLVFVLLAAVTTAVVLPFVSVPLIHVVLAGGRFTGADAVAVGSFVAWMAPGIGAHMVLMVAVRALLAERAYLPLLGAALSTVVLVPTVAAFAEPILQLDGVAAGYSAGYLAAALITFVAAWRLKVAVTATTSLQAPAHRSQTVAGRAAVEDAR